MGCFTSKPETVEDKPLETEEAPTPTTPTKRAPEVKPLKLPDIPESIKDTFHQISDMLIIDSVWTGTMTFESNHSELLELKMIEVNTREEKLVSFQTERPLDHFSGKTSKATLSLILELTKEKQWVIKLSYEDISVPEFLMLEAKGDEAFDLGKCKIIGRCGIPNQKAGSFFMVRTITPHRTGLAATRSTRTFSEDTWGQMMAIGSMANKAYLKQEEKRKSDLAYRFSSGEIDVNIDEDSDGMPVPANSS